MNYKHFIITRFNLTLKFRGGKIFNALDADYLQKRMDIFEKYTFPSVYNQSNKNFTWLVLFHKGTPVILKDRIRKLEQKFNLFTPLFLDDDESAFFAEYITKYLNNFNCRHVLTSRLDNDDCLHANYIEDIQNYIDEDKMDQGILTFPHGLQYNIDKNIVANLHFIGNHFLSLICENKIWKNHILHYDHGLEIDVDVPVQKVEFINKAHWLEIIHDTNVSNRQTYKFKNMVTNHRLLQDYAFINLQSKKEYFKYLINYISEVIKQLPIRALKNLQNNLKHFKQA
jgi:hypothetical protein